MQLNLKEGLLKTNIGIPLVFLINKSDIVMQTGERKRFEEDSEFIVKHIRNFALACNNYKLKFQMAPPLYTLRQNKIQI